MRTKKFVHEYNASILNALDEVVKSDIPVTVKRSFFKESSLVYGHTALMLFGGDDLCKHTLQSIINKIIQFHTGLFQLMNSHVTIIKSSFRCRAFKRY